MFPFNIKNSICVLLHQLISPLGEALIIESPLYILGGHTKIQC